MTSSDAITKKLTVPELVREYREAATEIRDAFRRIAAAEERLNDAFTLNGNRTIGLQTHRSTLSFNDPDRALEEATRDVWTAIVERLEVRRMMSVARWTKLSEQLQRGDMPEITEENVWALVSGFERELPAMLEEAVEEVFEWLRPHRSKYKTNTELEVPRKVILGYVVDRWDRFTHSWRVNYRYEPNLTALENVFTALDGQGQITKGHYSKISEAIRADGFAGQGRTEYFAFKCFMNGNLHLEFLREDLLARFNAIAGGRRLRPAAAE